MDTVEEFWTAIGAGDEEKVRELVTADPALTSARNPQEVSPVLAAAYAGHLGLARILASAGAELDLFGAAALGDRHRVETLLNEDPAKAHTRSSDGFTALHLASFFGQVDVVELLLELGADPNVTARNAMRVRPVHSAAAYRDRTVALETVRSLVEHGAEINVAQEGGWTPLHQAAAHGASHLVEYLLHHGADPTARSTDGRVPLDMARAGGYARTAELLEATSTSGQ